MLRGREGRNKLQGAIPDIVSTGGPQPTLTGEDHSPHSLYFFFFWGRVCLCSPGIQELCESGWLWTHRGLGLKAHATTPLSIELYVPVPFLGEESGGLPVFWSRNSQWGELVVLLGSMKLGCPRERGGFLSQCCRIPSERAIRSWLRFSMSYSWGFQTPSEDCIQHWALPGPAMKHVVVAACSLSSYTVPPPMASQWEHLSLLWASRKVFTFSSPAVLEVFSHKGKATNWQLTISTDC